MSSIGQRIKSEREAQGISRTDLSKKTGIGYSTLAELENGRMQSSTRLHVIADALGVLASYLETGKEPKRPTAQSYHLSEGDSGFLISEPKAPSPDELPTDALVNAIAKAMSQIPSDLVPAAAKVMESLASSPNSEMLKSYLGQMICSGRGDVKR